MIIKNIQDLQNQQKAGVTKIWEIGQDEPRSHFHFNPQPDEKDIKEYLTLAQNGSLEYVILSTDEQEAKNVAKAINCLLSFVVFKK